ncbi:class I SAM-dependent methyltransferase [Calothrix sp. 336/3]|uniref:class I SAM-dependent methyltransferase n=1 Tax=Calothrix sp. 336/3 TaxID=1337936 RepID=UPI0004E29B2F|nr:methyltransferase domain-containing protein [Calothrix sp. 336/3]AKG23003.1 type 12 methyltransferase [Calothrix sp. 336/3]
MEKDFYLQYAATEDKHWWFVGRRCIIDQRISQIKLPNHPQILEVGCGTGGNLQMLANHGELAAMELDESACHLANQRGVTPVKLGSLPDNIPFNQQFHLILMLDVLEHLDDDLAALQAIFSRLKPGGKLLITVPAYQFLWSQHDVINHHKRRYVMRSLARVVKNAGYVIEYRSYFNTFLFPVVAIIRWLKNILDIQDNPSQTSELTIPRKPINQLLSHLFASEGYLMKLFPLPFGVSILMVAEKPQK